MPGIEREGEKPPARGRIVVVNFMSLDGVIQAPLFADEDRDGGFEHGGWILPYSDEQVDSFMQDATVAAAGMLLGRRSYEILRDAWAQADESDPAVAAMNEMPKYVVASAPVALSWAHSHIVEGHSRAIQELTARVKGDIVVFGSGALVRSLAERDLVDEYRLLVFPLIIGGGKRMFDERGRFARFSLTHSATTTGGVVIARYLRER